MARKHGIWLLPLVFTLAACGGGGIPGTNDDDGGDGGGNGGNKPIKLALGILEGGTFTEGAIKVGVTGTLSAHGSTSVTVHVVDKNSNTLMRGVPFEVSFYSSCSEQSWATLDSPAKTTTGEAKSTYTAQGCNGLDLIVAALPDGDNMLYASGSINVAPAELGSIMFLEAQPKVIGLKGTGQNDVSTLTLLVRDKTGAPVPNQEVGFNLSTTVGGIELVTPESISNANGEVQVLIKSGTVSTPVAVYANATRAGGGSIYTQSGYISITTGIADRDSFSLAFEKLNPGHFNFDGVTNKITIQLADHFNNPALDGTNVNFWVEGGQVQGTCMLEDGICSVRWRSADPRPIRWYWDATNPLDWTVVDRGSQWGDGNGVVSLLAFTEGEETFVDSNGNHRFDDDDITFFDLLGEPFQDNNGDNVYDPAGTEPFVDVNGNGVYDAGGDGLMSSVLCQHSTLCAPESSVMLWESARFVMSGRPLPPTINPPAGDLNLEGLIKGTLSNAISVATDGYVTIEVIAVDANGNILSEGTQISAKAAWATVEGDSSYTIDNSFVINQPPFDVLSDGGEQVYNKTSFYFTLKGGQAAPTSGFGSLKITVTDPQGYSGITEVAVIPQ